jgi:hypothetical protein
MKCPNCVLGDLHFVIRGEFRFKTDQNGRPCETAEARTTPDRSWLQCDTCEASFGVAGWRSNGSGEAILVDTEDSEDSQEDSPLEIERETPPPNSPRIE